MAFDPAVNHSAVIMGATVEYGEATMGAANTVEVPTQLREIQAAFATYKEAPAAAVQIFCDLVITLGCVTFADGAVASKKFNYRLYGLS
ncbi:MAG TPA: hypothetical protein VMY35_12200 [Phycisphaerae bacterium]|nr:hypothetical protein [Phycisphaerae bacterium]